MAMHKRIGSAAALMALFCSAGAAGAADLVGAVPEPPPPAEEVVPPGWSFTIAPYVWAAGIEGRAGVFGFPPQDIGASFSDVLSNLEGALMLVGTARYDRYSLFADLVYTRIGTSVSTPFGILANELDVDATLFVGTAALGYAVLSDPSLTVDVIAGARLWHADNDFGFQGGVLDGRSRSDGDTWVDPILGARLRADLGDSNFYVAGWGMVGGFGAGSDFSWDVLGGAGYEFNETVSLFAGYRAFGADYENDGFVFDLTQHGPVIGGVFQF